MIPYERIKQHLAGDTVPLVEREDYFWAAIGGADVTPPTPLNPWEECLAAIVALISEAQTPETPEAGE